MTPRIRIALGAILRGMPGRTSLGIGLVGFVLVGFVLVGSALVGSALVGSAAGCGRELPARYVVERDLGPFFYRRYQRTLDVEFVIPDNPAVGHTATYVRRGSDALALATAFVTVFDKSASLSAEVRERLEGLSHYQLAVGKVGGDHAWTLALGNDERWAVWVSGRYVVKLGAPRGEPLPGELADAYMNAYPSDLDEHGRAREGTTSRGPSRREREAAPEPDRPIPASLAPNAPR
jgi:hypothetical protein